MENDNTSESTKALKDMIYLNHLKSNNDIEDKLIKSGNIHECPYFKEKLICHVPDLKENDYRECKCFKFQINI